VVRTLKIIFPLREVFFSLTKKLNDFDGLDQKTQLELFLHNFLIVANGMCVCVRERESKHVRAT